MNALVAMPTRPRGAKFFDPDAVLEPLVRAADDLPAAFVGYEPVVVSSAHPNDALAYHPEFERPTADKLRAMLPYVRLEDAPGKRRGPWFQVLAAVHHWSGGSDEGFELIHEWSATQPGYVDEADVRKIWDSCGRYTGKPIEIGSVFKLAYAGGYNRDPPADDEEAIEVAPAEAPAETPESGALSRVARLMKERIDASIAGGMKKQEAALQGLQDDLIFVADQTSYFSKTGGTLLNQYGIRQLYKAAMPPKGDGRRMDPCKLLENSITKRIAESMAFHPGEADVFVEHGRVLANWHRPWNVAPEKPTREELERFRYLLNHIGPRKADKLFMDYVLAMLAYSVQHPGKKVASAPLLYSAETGTGKTTMLYEVPRFLFGPPNSQLVSNAETESGFSDFLARSHFLHLDEIFMGGMTNAAAAGDKFKPIITNSTIRVHPKGFAGYDTTNHLIVTACSNKENALYITEHDRRWAVHEVRSGKLDKTFASEFYAWLEGPRGAAVLKYIFLNIPTAGFNPHADAPMTAEKRAMVAQRDDLVAEIRAMCDDGTPPFHRELFRLDDLRYALGQRMPKFKNTGATRLRDALGGVAEPLPYARRTGDHGKQQRWWTTGNALAWSAATDEQIKQHILEGAALPVPDMAPATPVSAEA